MKEVSFENMAKKILLLLCNDVFLCFVYNTTMDSSWMTVYLGLIEYLFTATMKSFLFFELYHGRIYGVPRLTLCRFF